MTTTHGGKIRTEWFAGPMPTINDAERFASLINRIDPGKCGRGAGDRTEGAFVTEHYGTLTVGVRGCERYRTRVFAAFEVTGRNLIEATR